MKKWILLSVLPLAMIGCFGESSPTSSNPEELKGPDYLLSTNTSYVLAGNRATLVHTRQSCDAGGWLTPHLDTNYFDLMGSKVGRMMYISSSQVERMLRDNSGFPVLDQNGNYVYAKVTEYDTTTSYYGGGSSLENSEWKQVSSGDTSIMELKGGRVYRLAKDYCVSRDQGKYIAQETNVYGNIVEASIATSNCNSLSFGTVVGDSVKEVKISYLPQVSSGVVKSIQVRATVGATTCNATYDESSDLSPSQCTDAWAAYLNKYGTGSGVSFYASEFVQSASAAFDSCVSTALGVPRSSQVYFYRMLRPKL